ncbi:hypothetical protein Y032_0002g1084 [Ancylostoma ceylanicum]|nr:hypothetical protein Y032_0002g1084 [Ancylostoma ceylanicum]
MLQSVECFACHQLSKPLTEQVRTERNYLKNLSERRRLSCVSISKLIKYPIENLDTIIADKIHGSRDQAHHLNSLEREISLGCASTSARAMNNFVTSMRNRYMEQQSAEQYLRNADSQGGRKVLTRTVLVRPDIGQLCSSKPKVWFSHPSNS